jgi:flagellar capping protein FliD
MASIQSLGIGSGILTTALVDDLVAAERSSVDLRLTAQKTEFEAEISAFGALTSALENLRTATSLLTKPGAMDAIVATSSDSSALTATVSSVAESGNFSVTIDKLAQSHSLATGAYSAITDVIGTGELTFRFGTTTFAGTDYDAFSRDTDKLSKTLVVDASNNTLASLRESINSADFGVSASIVDDGTGFRLLLATEDTGVSNSMEISVANDAGSGLKALAFNSDYNGAAAVGAITADGGTDLSAGIDFSATPATFSLQVGAVPNIDVTVNIDTTQDLGGGGNTSEDNRIAIQAGLDTALIAAGLSAGDVVASIDAVTAGVVFTTLGTGSSETIEVTADNGVLGLNTALGSRYGSNGSMSQTQAAQAAAFSVNGLAITRETNQVAGVISGVTLNLASADSGTTVNLSLGQDSVALTAKVQGFVDSFNELKVISDELSKFEVDSGEKGILLGDATLRGINTRMRSIMNSVVSGIKDSNFRSLSEVGIYTNQNNNFLLELDVAKFDAAVESNPDGIRSLFSTNTNSTDPLIEVINTGSTTLPGDYAVEITRLASQGVYYGVADATFDNSITVDDNNDTFVISVNGTDSGSVTLTQGDYASGALMAQELQLRINNDTAISAAGESVTVNYDELEHRFEFSSSKYGATSAISFSSESVDTVATLGLGAAAGSSIVGLDVAGTINGEVATGNGQLLRASEGALAAKPGFVSGLPSASPSVTSDGGVDYQFAVTVDGETSGTVTLAAGTYADGAAMAVALSSAINGGLAATGKSVTVDYDAGLNTFGVISSSTGIASSVNFTSLGGSLASAFGLAVGAGTQGADASGEASAAAGIRVRVTGGALGARGTVGYIQGSAYKLGQMFDDILGSEGILGTKVSSLTTLLNGVGESQTQLDSRMTAFQSQLSSQFAAADGLISQLNTTQDFLTTQLDLLSSFYSNNK